MYFRLVYANIERRAGLDNSVAGTLKWAFRGAVEVDKMDSPITMTAHCFRRGNLGLSCYWYEGDINCSSSGTPGEGGMRPDRETWYFEQLFDVAVGQAVCVAFALKCTVLNHDTWDNNGWRDYLVGATAESSPRYPTRSPYVVPYLVLGAPDIYVDYRWMDAPNIIIRNRTYNKEVYLVWSTGGQSGAYWRAGNITHTRATYALGYPLGSGEELWTCSPPQANDIQYLGVCTYSQNGSRWGALFPPLSISRH